MVEFWLVQSRLLGLLGEGTLQEEDARQNGYEEMNSHFSFTNINLF